MYTYTVELTIHQGVDKMTEAHCCVRVGADYPLRWNGIGWVRLLSPRMRAVFN